MPITYCISSEDDAAGGTEVVSEDVVSDGEGESASDISDVHSPDSKFTMVAVSPPCVGGEPTSPIPPPIMEMIMTGAGKDPRR